MNNICIKALISGRVQGVFFRQSTKKQAQQMGITGHAINLQDGRVEVLACGDEEMITQLLKWLEYGPELAQVNHIDYHQISIEPPSSFTTG